MAEIEGFAESGPPIRIGLAVVCRTTESEAPLKRRSNRPDVIGAVVVHEHQRSTQHVAEGSARISLRVSVVMAGWRKN